MGEEFRIQLTYRDRGELKDLVGKLQSRFRMAHGVKGANVRTEGEENSSCQLVVTGEGITLGLLSMINMIGREYTPPVKAGIITASGAVRETPAAEGNGTLESDLRAANQIILQNEKYVQQLTEANSRLTQDNDRLIVLREELETTCAELSRENSSRPISLDDHIASYLSIRSGGVVKQLRQDIGQLVDRMNLGENVGEAFAKINEMMGVAATPLNLTAGFSEIEEAAKIAAEELVALKNFKGNFASLRYLNLDIDTSNADEAIKRFEEFKRGYEDTQAKVLGIREVLGERSVEYGLIRNGNGARIILPFEYAEELDLLHPIERAIYDSIVGVIPGDKVYAGPKGLLVYRGIDIKDISEPHLEEIRKKSRAAQWGVALSPLEVRMHHAS